MSYDVSFSAKLEGCETYVSVGGGYNYTCNMGEAIRKANKQGLGIPDFNGKKASDVLPVLKEIITNFVTDTKEYRQYEPSNGWGSIETCLEFLLWFKGNCEEYPTAIIEVSY